MDIRNFILSSNVWTRIIFALVLGVAVFLIIISISGKNSFSVFKILIIGGWGTTNAITESIVKAIPVMLCAIAVSLPAKLGLLNIGGEGQLIMGSIGASFIALNFPSYSSPILLLMMGIAAAVFGGIWGLIPGVIKATTRGSEIVISLLLNYVAIMLMLHLIHGPWKDPMALGWAQTKAFSPHSVLPTFFNTRIHILLVMGIIISLLLAIFVKYSKWGIAFKIILVNPNTAKYAGIAIKKYFILAFFIGGAIAALAGFGEVSVINGRLREGISLSYGYTGFLIAWLCGNRFLLIPIVSLLIGGFLSGADVLQISAGLPFATISILQGTLLIAVLVAGALELNKGKRST